jgi:hypothetical protein
MIKLADQLAFVQSLVDAKHPGDVPTLADLNKIKPTGPPPQAFLNALATAKATLIARANHVKANPKDPASSNALAVLQKLVDTFGLTGVQPHVQAAAAAVAASKPSAFGSFIGSLFGSTASLPNPRIQKQRELFTAIRKASILSEYPSADDWKASGPTDGLYPETAGMYEQAVDQVTASVTFLEGMPSPHKVFIDTLKEVTTRYEMNLLNRRVLAHEEAVRKRAVEAAERAAKLRATAVAEEKARLNALDALASLDRSRFPSVGDWTALNVSAAPKTDELKGAFANLLRAVNRVATAASSGGLDDPALRENIKTVGEIKGRYVELHTTLAARVDAALAAVAKYEADATSAAEEAAKKRGETEEAKARHDRRVALYRQLDAARAVADLPAVDEWGAAMSPGPGDDVHRVALNAAYAAALLNMETTLDGAVDRPVETKNQEFAAMVEAAITLGFAPRDDDLATSLAEYKAALAEATKPPKPPTPPSSPPSAPFTPSVDDLKAIRTAVGRFVFGSTGPTAPTGPTGPRRVFRPPSVARDRAAAERHSRRVALLDRLGAITAASDLPSTSDWDASMVGYRADTDHVTALVAKGTEMFRKLGQRIVAATADPTDDANRAFVAAVRLAKTNRLIKDELDGPLRDYEAALLKANAEKPEAKPETGAGGLDPRLESALARIESLDPSQFPSEADWKALDFPNVPRTNAFIERIAGVEDRLSDAYNKADANPKDPSSLKTALAIDLIQKQFRLGITLSVTELKERIAAEAKAPETGPEAATAARVALVQSILDAKHSGAVPDGKEWLRLSMAFDEKGIKPALDDAVAALIARAEAIISKPKDPTVQNSLVTLETIATRFDVIGKQLWAVLGRASAAIEDAKPGFFTRATTPTPKQESDQIAMFKRMLVADTRSKFPTKDEWDALGPLSGLYSRAVSDYKQAMLRIEQGVQSLEGGDPDRRVVELLKDITVRYGMELLHQRVLVREAVLVERNAVRKRIDGIKAALGKIARLGVSSHQDLVDWKALDIPNAPADDDLKQAIVDTVATLQRYYTAAASAPSDPRSLEVADKIEVIQTQIGIAKHLDVGALRKRIAAEEPRLKAEAAAKALEAQRRDDAERARLEGLALDDRRAAVLQRAIDAKSAGDLPSVADSKVLELLPSERSYLNQADTLNNVLQTQLVEAVEAAAADPKGAESARTVALAREAVVRGIVPSEVVNLSLAKFDAAVAKPETPEAKTPEAKTPEAKPSLTGAASFVSGALSLLVSPSGPSRAESAPDTPDVPIVSRGGTRPVTPAFSRAAPTQPLTPVSAAKSPEPVARSRLAEAVSSIAAAVGRTVPSRDAPDVERTPPRSPSAAAKVVAKVASGVKTVVDAGKDLVFGSSSVRSPPARSVPKKSAEDVLIAEVEEEAQKASGGSWDTSDMLRLTSRLETMQTDLGVVTESLVLKALADDTRAVRRALEKGAALLEPGKRDPTNKASLDYLEERIAAAESLLTKHPLMRKIGQPLVDQIVIAKEQLVLNRNTGAVNLIRGLYSRDGKIDVPDPDVFRETIKAAPDQKAVAREMRRVEAGYKRLVDAANRDVAQGSGLEPEDRQLLDTVIRVGSVHMLFSDIRAAAETVLKNADVAERKAAEAKSGHDKILRLLDFAELSFDAGVVRKYVADLQAASGAAAVKGFVTEAAKLLEPPWDGVGDIKSGEIVGLLRRAVPHARKASELQSVIPAGLLVRHREFANKIEGVLQDAKIESAKFDDGKTGWGSFTTAAAMWKLGLMMEWNKGNPVPYHELASLILYRIAINGTAVATGPTNSYSADVEALMDVAGSDVAKTRELLGGLFLNHVNGIRLLFINQKSVFKAALHASESKAPGDGVDTQKNYRAISQKYVDHVHTSELLMFGPGLNPPPPKKYVDELKQSVLDEYKRDRDLANMYTQELSGYGVDIYGDLVANGLEVKGPSRGRATLAPKRQREGLKVASVKVAKRRGVAFYGVLRRGGGYVVPRSSGGGRVGKPIKLVPAFPFKADRRYEAVVDGARGLEIREHAIDV